MSDSGSDDVVDALSAGGIVMIIIAGVGILTAFTTIICMFIMARKRATTESRLSSALQRNLANSQSAVTRGRSANDSSRVFTLPMNIFPFDTELPKYDDVIKFPPSYEEALRMTSSPPTTPHSPLSPTTSLTSNLVRTATEMSVTTQMTSLSEIRSESPKPGRSVTATIEDETSSTTPIQISTLKPISVPKIEVTEPKEFTTRPGSLNIVPQIPSTSTLPKNAQNENNTRKVMKIEKKSDSKSSEYGDSFNV